MYLKIVNENMRPVIPEFLPDNIVSILCKIEILYIVYKYINIYY